jgi:hypothetical protein
MLEIMTLSSLSTPMDLAGCALQRKYRTYESKKIHAAEHVNKTRPINTEYFAACLVPDCKSIHIFGRSGHPSGRTLP